MRFKSDADEVRWKLDCQKLISLLQKKIIIPAPFKRWVVMPQYHRANPVNPIHPSMINKCQLFLWTLFSLILSSCQSYSGQHESQTTGIDTLQVSDLSTVVSTESALLGDPREIVSMDANHLAVYDHSYKKIIIFNSEGDKLDEFGNIGEGPGEWDSMSGAADLNFLSDRFFTSNRGRFLFDLYDRSGNHNKSISFPQYLSYSHKTLLPDNKLLVASNGRENSLAAVMDLNEKGNIIKRIGSPESEYSEARNLEQERMTYSNGEIPENDRNKALAAKGEDGYFIFMTALGELRHYSEGGELIFQKEIPEIIKTSVFDFVVHHNKDVARERTVVPLAYAKEMYVHNDLIYLFMPKPHSGAIELDFRILVYNTNGELLRHYVFDDPKNEHFFYGYAMGSDNTIYLMDIMRAKVLRFIPDVD